MFFQKFTIFLVFMMSTLLAYGRFEPGDLVSQRKKWSAAAGVSSPRVFLVARDGVEVPSAAFGWNFTTDERC